MLRRLLIIGSLAAGLLLTGLAGDGAAQGQQDDRCTTYGECVGPDTTPSPNQPALPDDLGSAFEVREPDPGTIPTPVPTSVPEASDGGADAPQLAFTGGESDVLAYVGSGLFAVGALVVVARRRMEDDA